MAKIINIKERLVAAPDNLITSRPWEFRRADWESGYFIQMIRSQSTRLEYHRKYVHQNGVKRISDIPPHFVLKGGMSNTIKYLYAFRDNREKMLEIYYLAGLIDCMINQVNPMLRTEMISDIYAKINTLKTVLSIKWFGRMDQVLLPVDNSFYNHNDYRARLADIRTMKGLYSVIKNGTREMFDIISNEYIFYTPGRVS